MKQVEGGRGGGRIKGEGEVEEEGEGKEGEKK